MGGDRVKCGDRFEREIDQKKSLRTAVLRYGLPAGSHFIFYSPVCIPTMHGGKRGFFYIWAGKSHPRERTTEWPVFLLIIFICLFCSLCSSSKALSHHDAQQFFKADSGAACCIAGSDGIGGSCSEFLLLVDSAVPNYKWLFTAVAGQETSVCLHHCWWGLWLFITSWSRSFC